MKKHLLILLLAVLGISIPASATLTIPWEQSFTTNPTFGGEDNFERERLAGDTGSTTAVGWYFTYYNNTTFKRAGLSVQSTGNLADRAIFWPQMDFVAGETYYVEFSVPLTLSAEWSVTLFQASGTTVSTSLGNIIEIKAKQMAEKSMDHVFGAYFVAKEGCKRIGIRVTNSVYSSSRILLNDFKIAKAHAGLPSAVSNLKGEGITPGVKTAKVTMTAPSTNVSGGELTSLSGIKLYQGETLAADITDVTPGGQIETVISADMAGTVNITAIPYNEHGDGQTSSIDIEIGGELPDDYYIWDVIYQSYNPTYVPTHLKSYAIYTPEGIKVSWDEGAEGAIYKVVAMPSGDTVAENITACEILDTNPMPEESSFRWYKIYTVAGDTETQYSFTNALSINNTVPTCLTPSTKAELTQFTPYVQEGASSIWQTTTFNGKNMITGTNKSSLVFPGYKLEAGKNYQLNIYTMVNYNGATLNVKVGTSNTLESQTIDVITDAYVKDDYRKAPNGKRYTGYFSVESDGLYFPSANYSNPDDKNGSALYITKFELAEVGPDLPGAIKSYSIAFNPADATKATITFNAPSKNISGNDLASVGTIKIEKDGELYKEITDVQPGEEVSVEVEASATELIVYNIYAVNESGVGAETNVSVFMINPPYEQPFTGEKSLNGYTIIANEELTSFTWHIQNDAARSYPNNGKLNDWMITPPIHLEGGKYYKTQFTTWGTNYANTNQISLYLGTAPTVEGMTEEIIAPYTILGENSNQAVLLKEYFTVPETGEYYLGFHSFAENTAAELYVDNFSISDKIDPRVPNKAENLTITPDNMGALKGYVSFTVPNVQINGEPLTYNPNYTYLYLDGELYQELGACKPGQKFNVPVTVKNEGVHLFTVIFKNNFGEGREAEDIAFFGINRPGIVNNITVLETSEYGVVNLTWDKPTTDYDGFPINPDLITYNVFLLKYDYQGNPYEQAIAEGLTDNKLTCRLTESTAKQDFYRFGIRSYTRGGGSPGVLAPYVNVGIPETTPFHESFANTNPSMRFVNQQLGELSSWGYNSELNEILPQDGDKGFAVFESPFIDGCARLMGGKVDLTKLTHPAMTLWVYNNGATPDVAENEFTLEVRPFGTVDWVPVETRTVTDLTCGLSGWVKVQFDLAPVAGKVIQFAFTPTCKRQVYTLIDNVTIDEYSDNNIILLDMETPEAVAPGREFSISARTLNIGNNEAEEYSVELYRNGELVSTRACGALAPRTTGRVRFTDVIDATGIGEQEYTAKVVYNLDNDPSDDTATTYLTLHESQFPGVENLAADQSNPSEIALSWTAPKLRSEAEVVTEDFDEYAPWTNMNDQMGGWTMYDVDDQGIGGVVVQIDGQLYSLFPAKVEPYTKQAFFVFDGNASQFVDNATFNVHSGGQCLMAMAAYPSYNPTSDWLVSPVLTGKAQTISFYARCYGKEGEGCYPESFRVLVNTDMESTNPSTFTELAAMTIDNFDWKKFEFELPEGSQHFAIEHCSANGFMLFIDDIEYTAGGTERLTPAGYNVYRNGTPVATAIRQNSFVDTEVPDGTHKYSVSVKYNLGESALSHTFIESSAVATLGSGVMTVFGGKGVINITGDYNRADIFATDGAHLYTVSNEKEISMAAGIYMVHVDGAVYKVIVK